jgi:hypothetical protein
MDPLRPPFLLPVDDAASVVADVRGGDGTLTADLSGHVRGPVVPCRVHATAPIHDDGTPIDRAPYRVELEMFVDALAPLVVELAADPDDPEAALEAQLARASDPALARLRVDDAVQAAWLGVGAVDPGRAPRTLRITRGHCLLRAVVAPWDRRTMGKLVGVMSALSTSAARLGGAIDRACEIVGVGTPRA